MPTLAGRRFACYSQPRRRFLHVLRAHRISIHLRTVKRRQIGIRNDILSQYASQRFFEFHTLCRERLCLLPYNLNSFRDRYHFPYFVTFTPFAVKKPKGRFWTGLSRLAEAFSLNWLPSSPRQPHSPLDRIVVKTGARSSVT